MKIILILPLIQSKVSMGFCRNPDEVANFDEEAFEGEWYEIKRDKDH